MRLHLFDAREYIFIAGLVAVLVDHDKGAEIVKQGQHMAFGRRHDECVCLAGRFVNEGAFPCLPLMFQVAPAAVQRIARYGSRMAMAADDTLAGRAREIYPRTLGNVVHQRTKPDPFAPRHPHTIIILLGVNDEFILASGGSGMLRAFISSAVAAIGCSSMILF